MVIEVRGREVSIPISINEASNISIEQLSIPSIDEICKSFNLGTLPTISRLATNPSVSFVPSTVLTPSSYDNVQLSVQPNG